MQKCKGLFVVILLIAISGVLFAKDGEKKPNYNEGNGTIIFEQNKNNVKTTIRKCELDVTIGDLLYNENRTIFDNYKNGKIIGTLADNDKVKVLEACSIVFTDKPKSDWGEEPGEYWYKIKKGNTTGWIHVNLKTCGESTDHYYDNNYEILETIKRSGKTWTVRKLNQLVAVWVRLNVRDFPGLGGKKVFMLHDFDEDSGRYPQENHEIIAITEETETIDGITDHWLKVEYEKGKFGWIFGGYTSVERGGPKYTLPEGGVRFDLEWY